MKGTGAESAESTGAEPAKSGGDEPVKNTGDEPVENTTDKSAVLTIKAGEWTIRESPHLGEATNDRTGEQVVIYDHRDLETTCDTHFGGSEVISVVGTFVSIETDVGGDCGGAHPLAWHRFEAFDLARAGHRVTLRELVDSWKLDAAIEDDPAYVKWKAAMDSDDEDVRHEAQCAVDMVPREAHFGFHHVKGDEVAVRIGLPHGCEVNRGNFTELGLYLELPSWLMERVKAADAADTLMPDLRGDAEP